MGVTKKEFSGGIYVDVILVQHIKTRLLDLLGIQTFFRCCTDTFCSKY